MPPASTAEVLRRRVPGSEEVKRKRLKPPNTMQIAVLAFMVTSPGRTLVKAGRPKVQPTRAHRPRKLAAKPRPRARCRQRASRWRDAKVVSVGIGAMDCFAGEQGRVGCVAHTPPASTKSADPFGTLLFAEGNLSGCLRHEKARDAFVTAGIFGILAGTLSEENEM